MAHFRGINKISSAPAAPTTLPDNAMMLVEIDGKVFSMSAATIKAVAALPTSAASASVGQVWNDNGVLKTKMS